ncbi:hypothetical protein AN958_09580 [Leucoagaricus sp. SymC.cos]|nr:hypothetical protein AN958_09580 [Leucoagaricus sp. SymC.cos]
MATGNIWCQIVDHGFKPIETPFYVSLGNDNANIMDLRSKVKDEIPIVLKDVDAICLEVRRCEEPKLSANATPNTLKRLIKTINFSDVTKVIRLASAETVSSLQLSENETLLVRLPRDHGVKRKHEEIKDEVAEQDHDIASKRLKYIQEQDASANAAQQKTLTPSETAAVTNIESYQHINPVFNGRPFDYSGPPIGLYHPVFNAFEKGLQANDPIPLDIRLNVQNFIQLSAEVYSSETERLTAVQPTLFKLFGGQLLAFEGKGVENDGTICVTTNSWNTSILIFELKNEIGSGNVDPFLQGTFAYQRYFSGTNYPKLRRESYCPSMLVAIAGPWICIGGAIYSKTPIAQPLTDFIWAGSKTSQACLERVFYCLRAAVTSLQQYYTISLPSTVDEGPCGFPYVREYNGKSFSYAEKLGGEELQVFKVKEGDVFRVIEFAKQYNEAAHVSLMETNTGEIFAPALRYISPPVYGGRRMVVMDYVDGKMMADETLSSVHFDQLKRALGHLHDAGFVFGDFREPNVIIKGDRVMLVDFDWCGKDGEATYPIDLNIYDDIQWAVGMGPGLVMRKEHDDYMFKKLVQRHTSQARMFGRRAVNYVDG